MRATNVSSMSIDNSLDHRRVTHHHQNQIQDAADSSSNIGTKESWEDILLNKYGRSTRTWKDDMPLGNMASMVKIRCPSNRGEDVIASKFMRRLMIKNKKVHTINFVLLSFKAYLNIPQFLYFCYNILSVRVKD